MAEDKTIVTKKTAAKPAATTKATRAKSMAVDTNKAPVRDTVGTKKTAARAAAPKPPAPPASTPPTAAPTARPGARPAAKPALRPAAQPALSSPAAKTSGPAPAKKTVTRRATARKAPVAEVSPAKPSPQPPMQEKAVNLQHLANVSPEERLAMIRDAAYYKAEKRNFAPGHEAQDWADAEREIDELLAKAKKIYGA